MLVNAAGFGRSGSVEEISMQRKRIQTDMVDLNCRALTRMTLLCLPYMHPGSRIINLASAAAFVLNRILRSTRQRNPMY